MDKNNLKKGQYSLKLHGSLWRNLKILAAYKNTTLEKLIEEYLEHSVKSDPNATFLLKEEA